MRRSLTLVTILAVLLAAAGVAEAAPSRKKSIWGPVQVNDVSQFPIYADLGAGLYQMNLRWDIAAPRRPQRPADPADPAYRWPPEVDYALSEAQKFGIQVSLLVVGAPSWANGRRPRNWAPLRAADFASFVSAAARRYPAVRHWMIWGEPSRREMFMPLAREVRGRPLSRRQARGPRRYARLLDAAYAALKAADRRNLVIGGNTFTTGDVSPRNFIRALRLPNGRPPRMDLYGHNPFTNRKPDLRKPPLGFGFADFSDLDLLARWIDRSLSRRSAGPRRLRLFLSEFFVPTDHRNHEFNFWVTQRTAAEWLASGLRIARRWKRIYTLGWFSLYDDPPRPGGDEVNRGLLTLRGEKKPAYSAFRRG